MTRHELKGSDLVFEPIGRLYLTPYQKKDKTIKNLRYWVVVLGAADIIYTILVALIIWNGWLR